VEDLVDHIQGFQWKKEPFVMEFSADNEVRCFHCFCM